MAWTVNGVNDTATYSYLPNSDLLHQLTTNSGQLTTYSYEPNRNLKTQVENQFNSQLISQYDYTYNTLGLREHSDTGGQAFTGTPIEPTPETSTYMTNSLNQYTQITKNDGQQTTDTLTYDDDGNLSSIISSGATKVYKYNAENRLIAVEPSTPINGDKKVEFVYDYMGRRVQKKVYIFESSAYSLQSIHLYVYDGWNMIQEMNGTGAVQKAYIWGLDLNQSLQDAGGVGGLLSVVDSGEIYHFLYDGNGNVGQIVKASDGTISAHYEYDPFGILLKSYGTKAGDNSFRYSTKYYETEIDLYYYGYRYYSSQLGRWISRDPINEQGGINLYAFVNNNSINLFDVLGRELAGGSGALDRYNEWYDQQEALYGPDWGGEIHYAPNPDPVVEATNKSLSDFLNGIPNSYSFGPSHPWTLRLKNHPHLTSVKNKILNQLKAYCASKTAIISAYDNFNLNDLSPFENAKWLGKDILSWITRGHYGQDRAFIFGSFRLHWVAYNIKCKSNCLIEAKVDFNASDILHLGSALRIPLTNIGPPDEPFGKGKRFNNISIKWNWSEKITL